jgi:GAF domain-containing protein
MAENDTAEELARARATIAAQAEELVALRQAASTSGPLADLRAAIETAATTNALSPGATHGRLLRLIVETAASVLDAETASIFLIDPETEELVFEVALGQDENEVRNWRLPAGTGIAGLVAATGQPMAVTGVQQDPRHAADVAQRMGRQPRSLLCVPLFLEDDVIGVLEVLDKRGAPGFGANDIATIGLFANQAAVAITQSRAHRTIAGLLREASGAAPTADAVADTLGHSPQLARSLQLAAIVRELASRGEAEAELAGVILRAVANYAGRRR